MTTSDNCDDSARTLADPREACKSMPIALPEPSQSLDQDAEWCVIQVDGTWRRIRFHDYDEIYKVPGLYERLFYDILKCNSPKTVCGLLAQTLESRDDDASELSVLDLGAGNGMVGEQLVELGAERVVGVDIIPEAKVAQQRDRPGVYEDYMIADFTELNEKRRSHLQSFRFNCLTCVAALGFGDIPAKAFTEAFNLLRVNSLLAFNIKEDFLDEHGDETGFSELIRTSAKDGILEIQTAERYRHRLATNGDPLHYVAVVAQKKTDLPDAAVGMNR